MKHLLKLGNLSPEQIMDILSLADQLKYEKSMGLRIHISRERPWA